MWLKMGALRITLSSFVILCFTVAVARGAEVVSECSFPAIYNFGDSNSDTGAISAAFLPIPAPYGELFFKKPAGRDCDGRLVIDFIAERLKLPYLSAYLNSIGSDYRHGANFATGGSTIQKPNETIYQYGISPFFLGMQVSHYDQFRERTGELYKQAKSELDRSKLPRPEDFPKALYTFDIGQNDLSMGFRAMTMDQLKQALPGIVGEFASAITHLYQNGARYFWVHNTGPIGCMPVAVMYYKNPAPGFLDQFGCAHQQNEMAAEFNRQLKDRVMKLRTELPEAAIIYVDMHSAKYGLIKNAKNQGFADPMKPCCGNHTNGANVWCGTKGYVNNAEIFGGACSNPNHVISWDGVHYSQAANKWFADHILSGSLSDPLIPVTRACLKH
ncbi:unnamed protein product [Rhodiola kirilowii]